MERTTKRTTAQQFQKLVEIMKKNPDVARGVGKFVPTKKSRAELWEKFATELNAMGPPMRSGREWNKVWLDYKLKLKRKISTNRHKTMATGGGSYTQRGLTPLERTVDELLHLQEAVNPTGMESEKENYLETPSVENLQQDTDLAPSSSNSRPRMTVEDRENIRMKALEKQSEAQDILCQKIANIEKEIAEMARYTRKMYELKKEELKLLEIKEERKKEENLEKKRQHKEKMEMKGKKLDLKYEELQLMKIQPKASEYVKK
ncbi:uncharacterized protein LOC128862902 [Anastrepha ludens]|uniref:uncharacterized protein LOC128862902 n=1 Tax=Anastrepha ludens TaxID=28586 RepID=UPI0023AFBE82|nr:uncharacterized protein LOC128862902 [Anastrepha ludens]